MDSIELRNYKTKYAAVEHPMIFVNGFSLDELLSGHFKDESLVGLVPSITWLWDEEEQDLAVYRLTNETSESSIVPLLVCPDDCDFSCTVLLAEVIYKGDLVVWNRFGFDHSVDDQIGMTVAWFEQERCFEFSKIEYAKFRDEWIALGRSG